MAFLLGMPVEVQWQIFHQLLRDHVEDENSEFGPHGNTWEFEPQGNTWESVLVHHTALWNLSHTCKHLNATTAPLLYQRVNVSICYPATLILVLRHISQFPKHAAFVRDLTIDSEYTCSSFSKSQRSFIVQEAYRLGLDLSFKSNSRLPQFGSLLIDVALCHLSAIQKLKLIQPLLTSSHKNRWPAPPDEASPFRWVGFEHASRLPPSFVLRSLQLLEVYPRGVKNDVTPEDKLCKGSPIALLRHTPALTYLVIGLCDQEQPGDGAIIQNPLPQLKYIHLADVVDKDLAAIQKFCPRLEGFRLGLEDCALYQQFGMFRTTEILRTASRSRESKTSATPALLKALLPLKETIHNLDLNCSTFCAGNIKELDQLSHFKALRSLRLLFGHWYAGDNAALVNKFPPHLESLCLGASDIPVDDLAILLSRCIRDGRLANLRRFEYTFLVAEATHPFPAGSEGISQEAAAALKECGVHCVFRPYPHPMYDFQRWRLR